MNWKINAALGATALLMATQVAAQITFYEHDDFRGRAFTTERQVNNFGNNGFNDIASSILVDRGRWEVCSDAQFGGQCIVLRKGSYPSLNALGMNDKISSVRPVNQQTVYQNEAPAPLLAPTYEYYQRPNERVYDAPVTSVRAVVGPPEQRCWIERQQVTERSDNNVGGAVVGALIGGVLGHQIGGGRGRDVATAGGAVAGALIGNNAGRGAGNTYDKDVQRCNTVASTTPAYWDVTYNYRGVEHRMQMSSPPGDTVAVNRNGEPRR